MNVLDFFGMSITQSILYCLLSGVVSVTFCCIGNLFYKGNRYLLQALLGMSFVAVLVLLSVSYCAFLAKYIIYSAIIFCIFRFGYQIYRRKISIKEFYLACLPFFLIYAYFILRIMLWETQQTGYIDFNCHMTYFSDIPLEIFRADYFSRLRITDIYPFEWSKYHFFNGCLTAIPLALFQDKSYVSYLFAKFLTIALYGGITYEFIKEKYKRKISVLVFLCGSVISFVLGNGLIVWSSFTNQYSSLFLFFFVWFALRNHEYELTIILGMILAVSTSRTILTGAAFAFYAIYLLWKKSDLLSVIKSNKMVLSFSFLVGMAILSMVFSGQPPFGENVISTVFVKKMFFDPWRSLIPLHSWLQRLEITKTISFFDIEILIIFLYIFTIVCYVKNINNVKSFLTAHKRLILLTSVLIASVYTVYMFDYYHGMRFTVTRYLVIPCIFFCIYLLPFACLYIGSGEARLPVCCFAIVVLLQFMWFQSAQGFCNWSLFLLPVVYLFIERCLDYKIMIFGNFSFKYLFLYLITFFGLIYVFSYNFYASFVWLPTDSHHYILPLQPVAITDKPFIYNTSRDINMARIHALRGNRVSYAVLPNIKDTAMRLNAMSMRFLPRNYRTAKLKDPLISR